MEDEALKYLEGLSYPIDINIVSNKLIDINYYDMNLINLVVSRNLKSLIKKFSKEVKDSSVNLAKKTTNATLKETGIPNIPSNILQKLNKYDSEKFLGLNNCFGFSIHDAHSQLELKFYKIYLLNLLRRQDIKMIIRIKDYFKLKRGKKVYDSEDLWNINKIKHLDYETIKRELDIKVSNFDKLIPAIKKLVSFKVTNNFDNHCAKFIEGVLNFFKDSDENSYLLREIMNISYALMSVASLDFISDTYKPVSASIIEKAFGFSVNEEEVTESSWRSLNMKMKSEVYIASFLLLSEDIYILRDINHLAYYQESNNKFAPEALNILKLICKNYPLFEDEKPRSQKLYKNSNKFMKLIDKVTSQKLLTYRSLSKEIFFHIENPILSKYEFIQADTNAFKLIKLNEVSSKHIIICVSGYLSENDNPKSAWTQVLDLNPNTAIYSYLWESSTYGSMVKNIFEYIKRKSSIFNDFVQSSERAMSSGVYLAELIKSQLIDRGFCVSLYGFSLGTLVITSCLAKLAEFQGYTLYDVVYLGSATSVNEASEMSWFKLMVVRGRLINVYSLTDYILFYVYKKARNENPCGLTTVEGMENFDVTKIVYGHITFRSYFAKIFEEIKL